MPCRCLSLSLLPLFLRFFQPSVYLSITRALASPHFYPTNSLRSDIHRRGQEKEAALPESPTCSSTSSSPSLLFHLCLSPASLSSLLFSVSAPSYIYIFLTPRISYISPVNISFHIPNSLSFLISSSAAHLFFLFNYIPSAHPFPSHLSPPVFISLSPPPLLCSQSLYFLYPCPFL